MGVAKELVELGFKSIKPAVKNFMETGLAKTDGKKLVHMLKSDPPKFNEMYSTMDTFTKTGNEQVGLGIIKELDKYGDDLEELNKASKIQNSANNPQGISIKPQDTSGVPTSENILGEFPIQPRNVDTDRPNFISEKDAKARNKAMKAAGITEYTDELGHNWNLEGVKSKQLRNTKLRKATKKAVNPFTDETGSRLGSTRASSDARSRDLVPSSAEEVKHVSAMRKEIAKINKDLGLKKGDPDFMTLEHRVAQKDWKRLNLPGNPADSANLWITKEYEAKTKTLIENIIRKRKSIKGEYIVNFNPQNNSLNITKLDEFDLGIPRGKRFKKNKQGLYNMDAIKQYLNTLE